MRPSMMAMMAAVAMAAALSSPDRAHAQNDTPEVATAGRDTEARLRAQREDEQQLLEDQREREARAALEARTRDLALREAQLAQVRQGAEIQERARSVQAQERELAAARGELERARREMEAAARQISRLSMPDMPALRGNYQRALSVFDRRGYIGASLEDDEAGARVLAVTPGGPAAGAGIVSGDVITVINGRNVTADGDDPSAAVVEVLGQLDPGATATVTVLRGDETRTFDVETTEGNAYFALRGGPFTYARAQPNGAFLLSGLFATRWSDMELVTLSETLGSYFGTTEGLLVVRAPDNDDLGLLDGDVILEIGGRTPSSPEHAMRILSSFAPGETLELEIMRERRRRNLEYEIPTTND